MFLYRMVYSKYHVGIIINTDDMYDGWYFHNIQDIPQEESNILMKDGIITYSRYPAGRIIYPYERWYINNIQDILLEES